VTVLAISPILLHAIVAPAREISVVIVGLVLLAVAHEN
jgi:hypothetical protein